MPATQCPATDGSHPNRGGAATAFDIDSSITLCYAIPFTGTTGAHLTSHAVTWLLSANGARLASAYTTRARWMGGSLPGREWRAPLRTFTACRQATGN
mmetsp:Transcript_39953/g.80026  ORF Transcript_39953/g.80026 Transcript_39953/m.80026 type:complete len:98 (-) Transcript_39953:339-632(-)